jgi:porin
MRYDAIPRYDGPEQCLRQTFREAMAATETAVNIRTWWLPTALIAFGTAVHADVRNPIAELGVEWGGIRSALYDSGIDFHIGYVSETASNVRGGAEELWRYADQLSFAALFDLRKILGINQAQFQVTVTDRNGRNLSADAHLDSLQEVQEIYGRGQTWHWTQFSYDQKYFDGRLDWKVGRLVNGEDFADFSCEFTNLALCGSPPGNMAVNYWYNWPVSSWGTRVKESLGGFGYVEIGAFEFNPRFLSTKNGLNLGEPGGSSGVLAPVEIGWQPRFSEGHDGTYKLGGWYNSSRSSDVVDNTKGQPLLLDGGQPAVHPGEYGEYVNFLQRLTAPACSDPKRGLSAFLNATHTDRRTSPLDSQVAAGLLYTGPFAPRFLDVIGLAVGRTHVNSRIAGAEALYGASRTVGLPVQTSEYVGEIFYSLHMAQWLQLRPDVQYVFQPGGNRRATDDVIVALRLSVNL